MNVFKTADDYVHYVFYSNFIYVHEFALYFNNS